LKSKFIQEENQFDADSISKQYDHLKSKDNAEMKKEGFKNYRKISI
jgi:hypothetical protein